MCSRPTRATYREVIGCGLLRSWMGSAIRHRPRHTTWRWQPQLNPYWLGRPRNKDRTFRCWPSGQRWKGCDWWTKIIRCQKQSYHCHLECEIAESSRKRRRTNTWNAGTQMEHPWTLWGTLEKLRRSVPRRPQSLLQWQWSQTWALTCIPHSQRHCECHHGMSTSL